jgi:hypothetical protein
VSKMLISVMTQKKNGTEGRNMNVINCIDDSLLDDAAQPLSERLDVLWNKNCFWIGIVCLAISVLGSFVIFSILMFSDFRDSIANSMYKIVIAGIEGLFLFYVYSTYDLGKYGVDADAERINPNRWILYGIRTDALQMSAAMLIFELLLWHTQAASFISVWWMAVIVRVALYGTIIFSTAGMYFLSCNPLPPGERALRKKVKKTTNQLEVIK